MYYVCMYECMYVCICMPSYLYICTNLSIYESVRERETKKMREIIKCYDIDNDRRSLYLPYTFKGTENNNNNNINTITTVYNIIMHL